ncbi:MAG: efflux RND transporter periplasmic adaptor subunit [Bacteroidetes bacterium]|nr:efflux RND transporter periplasmic adaptor subunit [Bacteroidota bacterium]
MEKFIISTAALALAITVCSCQSSAKEDKKPAANNKGQALKVDAYVVSPRKLSQDIEVPGSLAAYEEVELHTEAAGRVTGVYFKEGSFVQQGALLIKLYDGDLVAQLQKLQVQLKSAEQTADRYAALLKINGVSQQEYDLNVLAVNNIKADIDITKTSITKTSLRAPFSGKMGITTIAPGAYLSPTTAVATLRKVSQLKLQFMVPEKYISSMKPGSTVQFRIENNPKTFLAKISATENTVASDSRSLTVKAIVENPSSQLLAGVFAKVQIPLSENNDALMIPTQAVIPQTRDKKVLAVRNGIASLETVTTGIRDSANVEITSGLKAGDTVLITGLLATKPGTKVALNQVFNK